MLLLAALTIGLQIPGLSLLSGLPSGSRLDYTSRVGPLSGLSSDFVAKILGWNGGHRQSSELESAEIALTGQDGFSEGSGSLKGPDVHPSTNDDFKDARPARSLPYEARTTTNGSSREEGEPGACALGRGMRPDAAALPLGGTVWYRFTPEEDMGLIADTFGSDHRTTLAVYSGTVLEGLSEIGCDTDLNGLALVPFRAVARQTYFFQVSAFTSDVNALLGAGDLVFRLARQGITSLVSVGPQGQGNGPSDLPSLSADGRYVTFRSGASNLDPRYHSSANCPHGTHCGQLYVRDLERRTTALVSISSEGAPGNGPSGLGEESPWAALSADGRFIAFMSFASNLVEGDTNVCNVNNTHADTAPLPGACPDVFVHDRDADSDGDFDEDPRQEPGAVSTTLVSVSSTGEQGDDTADAPAISADGRFVAFASYASNLVEGDTNECAEREPQWAPPLRTYNCADVYVHDRLTAETTRVSVSSDGGPGNGDSSGVTITPDGRYVAFKSRATNLVDEEDTNECVDYFTQRMASCSDIFVHDRKTRSTTRVSISSEGEPGDGDSGGDFAGPSISADGRYVTFSSNATNLVEGDTQMCPWGYDAWAIETRVRNCRDVFVHDRDADRDGIFDEPGAISTVMASRGSGGQLPNLGAAKPAIAANGRYVAFFSPSTNLVPGDTNGSSDVFVRDLRTGVTIRVSISSEGVQADEVGWLERPGISSDGRILTFGAGEGLVEDDTNQSFDVFVHRLKWS